MAINDLTLTGGHAEFGGAIDNHAALTITNSIYRRQLSFGRRRHPQHQRHARDRRQIIRDNSADFGGAVVDLRRRI